MIRSATELERHWQGWASDSHSEPIGYILAMEGADPILNPEQAEHWWQLGLRAVGPAHYGHSHYAVGTGFDGPLTEEQIISRIGLIP